MHRVALLLLVASTAHADVAADVAALDFSSDESERQKLKVTDVELAQKAVGVFAPGKPAKVTAPKGVTLTGGSTSPDGKCIATVGWQVIDGKYEGVDTHTPLPYAKVRSQ